jgi:hypothetical protein
MRQMGQASFRAYLFDFVDFWLDSSHPFEFTALLDQIFSALSSKHRTTGELCARPLPMVSCAKEYMSAEMQAHMLPWVQPLFDNIGIFKNTIDV